MTTPTVAIGKPISLGDLWNLAHRQAKLVLEPATRERIASARAVVDAIVAQGDSAPAVYGVNTGFGALAETRIGAGDIETLQRNLIRSHACGVGPDLRPSQVRAMIVLRAQVVAMGHSGVRPEVVELLLNMLEHDILPVIPGQGSVGASGDLAPLAHLALGLIGEGEVDVEGTRMPAAKALEQAGLTPVVLQAKEGIALINGTQLMTAIGGLALERARRLCTIADLAGAISIEALLGSSKPFDARLMHVRPHPGQAVTAKNMRALLEGSELMISHRDCAKVQDPYSLRCIPQVHGATRDALGFARDVLGRELNSVTDNPTIFQDGPQPEFISGGNFHGQPVALALDFAAIAVAELANISERRVEQLVNPALSTGLPPFLTANSGLCSGFMIAQVTSAALVSENKVLCHPSSVDSIPSSANREDHVSMGSISSRKFDQVVQNVATCLAIELLVACQGIDLRKPTPPSPSVQAAHDLVRAHIAPLTDDRPLHLDFKAMLTLVDDGRLEGAVAHAAGALV